MAIRNKLLLLLLTVGLVPLLAISVLHRVTVRIAGSRVASNVRDALDYNARLSLQNLVQNCNEVLRREKQLIDSLVMRQALEAGIRLSQESGGAIKWDNTDDYGFNSDLDEFEHPNRRHFENASDTEENLRRISYRKQGYVLADGIEREEVEQDMLRLWSMTNVYHELYGRMPRGILRHYTSLENGLHTSYPAGRELPEPGRQDPRTRDWYLSTKEKQDVARIGPIIDASTGQVIITIAAPVLRRDGSFAGVTAIDRTISDILETMKLPHRWAEPAERFVVVYEPKDSPDEEADLTIMLQAGYADGSGSRQGKIELQRLESQDADQFRSMIEDIEADIAGVRKMEYNGRQALWAYGNITEGLALPILIVPYDEVVELADSMEESLLKDSVSWLKVTGVGLALVIAAAVTLAAVRARTLTKPISELAEASKKLSAGDYAARVDIATGDELQELGRIFNETGPKLKEHEKMQRSLELAKAIQQNLLPQDPPELEGFDIAGRCSYCDETGGDYYDFIELVDIEPGKLGIALGDVSGHGIGAALLMATARSTLRNNSVRYGTSLSKLLEEINGQLARDTEDDKFMTLFYGVLDDKNKSLIWASGGHDPALWYHKEADVIEELPNTGMPVGLMEDAAFEEGGPITAKTGDLIVVGTDGIWEAQNTAGEMFGKERLCEIISSSDASADDICLAVINAVTEFCGSAPRTDDITLVVIKVV